MAHQQRARPLWAQHRAGSHPDDQPNRGGESWWSELTTAYTNKKTEYSPGIPVTSLLGVLQVERADKFKARNERDAMKWRKGGQ